SLTELGLRGNAINDIGALRSLEYLTRLDLGQNAITDISSLKHQLTYIKTLDLADNPFNDIAALFDLRPQSVDLTGNNQLSCAQLDFLNSIVNTQVGSGVVLHDSCSNDIKDGRLKWRLTLDTQEYSSMALGPDNNLYTISSDHQLTAINKSGIEAWRFDIKGIAYLPRVSPDGTIYISSSDGNLYAVNPDGSQKWQTSPWPSVARTRAIAGDGTIYVADGKDLYAINPDGSQKWMKTLGDSVNSVRVGVTGQLFISQSYHTLSLNPDGTLLWTAPYGSGGDAIGNNDTLYFTANGATSGYFGAIDADGNNLFYSGDTDIWYSGPIISASGTFYASNGYTGLSIPSESGGVGVVFNPADTGFCSLVAGNDDVLYASSVEWSTQIGRFYAVDTHGGQVKWMIESQNRICSNPLIGSDGTVYFTDAGGILYAVETNSGGIANSPWPRSGANNGNTNSVNP
ncbi:MAG: PQQ-binding-like beta-propeller repeat protein, partial [Psychrosphaera sp.]|nr:PQQ-binding-like beta-propeller repeat protein [Psychrosphaera sp.]